MMRLHHAGATLRAHFVASLACLGLCIGSLAGCASPSPGVCRGDSECPGGGCVDGRCRPLAGSGDDAATAGSDLGAPPDLASMAPPPDAAHADAIAPTCSFNGDGIIQRTEAPFIVGLGALFMVSGAGQTVPVDVRLANGAWDFTSAVTGDHKFFDELIDPKGSWWSADFPSATFAQRIDANQSVLGVYRATQGALELLGAVSEQGGAAQTNLKYASPIRLLQFPLAKGDAWTSESDVSGLASGVYFLAHEKYQFTVDARGTTRVPAGSFDTLRLRIQYTQTYGFAVTTRFIYLHLAECYGAVARVRSKDNETSPDFTQSAEFRRLGSP